MIESRYWREELRDDVAWLRERRTHRGWSERKMVLYERRLILVAAQIRVLLDHHRVARRLVDARLSCLSYEKVDDRPTTYINRAGLEELFSDEGEADSLSIRDLCNQLLHHYVLFAALEAADAFTHLRVFSDYLKNDRLYEIEIPSLLDFLAQYAEEGAARLQGSMRWNPARQDFDVT